MHTYIYTLKKLSQINYQSKILIFLVLVTSDMPCCFSMVSVVMGRGRGGVSRILEVEINCFTTDDGEFFQHMPDHY